MVIICRLYIIHLSVITQRASTIVPADDMGVVGHTQKTQTPMSSAKKKTEKCISPVSSVKCLGKNNHMTWDLCIQKDAKHVMSTNSHTVHFTSHMNKDSILVHDYLLAVGIIQNNTSAVRIFQSHVNPFTSLFYLATIQQLFRSYLAAL